MPFVLGTRPPTFLGTGVPAGRFIGGKLQGPLDSFVTRPAHQVVNPDDGTGIYNYSVDVSQQITVSTTVTAVVAKSGQIGTGAIVEEVSPSPVNGTGTAITTASFTPVANSILIALCSIGGSGSGTPTGAVTDSLSSAWTMEKRQATNGEGSVEIWSLDVGASPAARTVTLTGTTALGVALTVKNYSAAKNVAGQTAVPVGASGTSYTISLTSTQLGSIVVGALTRIETSLALVVNSDTVALQSVADAPNGETYGQFESVGVVTTLGAKAYGYTNTPAATQTMAAMEVLPTITTGVITSNAVVGVATDFSDVTRVQDQSGTSSSSATSVTATLSPAATAGNIIWCAVGMDKSSGALTPPTGFTQFFAQDSASVSTYVGYKVATGGETAITLTRATASTAGDYMWVGEYSSARSGLWLIHGSATHGTDESTVLTWSSGTTAATTSLASALAFFSIDSGQSHTGTPTWSNSFTLVSATAEWHTSGKGDITAGWLATAPKDSTLETTHTHTPTGDQIAGAIVAFAKTPASPITATITASWSVIGSVGGSGSITGNVSQIITASASVVGIVDTFGSVTQAITDGWSVIGSVAGSGITGDVTQTIIASINVVGIKNAVGIVTQSETATSAVVGVTGAIGSVNQSITAVSSVVGIKGSVGIITATETAVSSVVGIKGSVGIITATETAVSSVVGIEGDIGAATQAITASWSVVGSVVSGVTGSVTAVETAVSSVVGITGAIGSVTAVETAVSSVIGIENDFGAVTQAIITASTVVGTVQTFGAVTQTITAGWSVVGSVISGVTGQVTATQTAVSTVVGIVQTFAAVTAVETAASSVVGSITGANINGAVTAVVTAQATVAGTKVGTVTTTTTAGTSVVGRVGVSADVSAIAVSVYTLNAVRAVSAGSLAPIFVTAQVIAFVVGTYGYGRIGTGAPGIPYAVVNTGAASHGSSGNSTSPHGNENESKIAYGIVGTKSTGVGVIGKGPG